MRIYKQIKKSAKRVGSFVLPILFIGQIGLGLYPVLTHAQRTHVHTADLQTSANASTEFTRDSVEHRHLRSLVVLDRETAKAIAYAHVMSASKMLGYTSEEGVFYNEMGSRNLWVHALGYQDTQAFSDTVYMEPVRYQFGQDIIVESVSDPAKLGSYSDPHEMQELENLLQGMDGISMIQRGVFAWEPSIRGLDDQRINLTIDGMQIFKACVDKMDPVTAYVDTDNLERLQVDKTGSDMASGGGKAGVNLVTKRANFNANQWSIESALRNLDGYHLFAGSADLSRNNHAFRLSGTYKNANDLVSGNGQTVPNSGYTKQNLNAAYRYQLDDHKVVDLSYILDHAVDVGYPALLMDATQATAHLFRTEMQWFHGMGGLSHRKLMVYANTVNHQMDDYSRDVSQRTVMPNMYMPMKGETKTMGMRWEEMLHIGDNNMRLVTEGYISNAFGDMKMESLLDIPDMYLINLGDIETNQLRLGVSDRWFPLQKLTLRLEANVTYNRVKLNNRESISFFEGITQGEVTPRAFLSPSVSSDMIWMLNKGYSLQLTGVFSQRAPSFTELYGHYIYNYVDGYFYDGNPNLKTEDTWNSELSLQNDYANGAWSVSAHYRRMNDYIMGQIDDQLSNSFYQFKKYEQIGAVAISGVDARWLQLWTTHFSSDIRLSYLYAQHLGTDEPLPLISPLNGWTTLSYARDQWSASVIFDAAAKQNRISTLYSNEDMTDPYLVVGLDLSKQWKAERLSTHLKVQNLTNAQYHRHTSIGNIPEQGRAVMLMVKFKSK